MSNNFVSGSDGSATEQNEWLPHDPAAMVCIRAATSVFESPSSPNPEASSASTTGTHSFGEGVVNRLAEDFENSLNVTEHRRANTGDSSQTIHGPGGGRTTLSIDAPAFVPRTCQSPSSAFHQASHAPATSTQLQNGSFQNQAEAYFQEQASGYAPQRGQGPSGPRWSSASSEMGKQRYSSRGSFHHGQTRASTTTDAIVNQVKLAIVRLTDDPTAYNSITSELLEKMVSCVHNDAVLYPIVSAVFSEAVTNSAYSNACGRISAFLATTYDLNEGNAGYTRLMLKRCYEEYSNRERLHIEDPSYVQRFENYVLFVAELYLQVEIEGKRIAMLRDILREVVFGYLSVPFENSLKLVCRILKFCGFAMEDDEKEESRGKSDQMDAIIGQIQVLVNMGNLPSIQDLMISLIDLRSSNWGRSADAVSYNIPQGYPAAEHDPYTYLSGGAECAAAFGPDSAFAGSGNYTYYGPDGVALTDEECSFLASNIPGFSEETYGEDEDEQIYEAYEQFLSTMQNQPTNENL